MQDTLTVLNKERLRLVNEHKVGEMLLLQSGFLSYPGEDVKFYTTPDTKEETRNRSIITDRNEKTSSVFIHKQHLNKVLIGYFNSKVEKLFNEINLKHASIHDVEVQLNIIDACTEAFNTYYFSEWLYAQKESALNRLNLEYLTRLVQGFVKYEPSKVKKESWVAMVRYSETTLLADNSEATKQLKSLVQLLIDKDIATTDKLFAHLLEDRGTDEGLMDILYMCKTIFGYKKNLVDVS